MHPENMKPEEATALYDQIVAEVKAEAAKEPAHLVTGAQVTWEIQKRWADACGVEFDAPAPAPPTGAPPQLVGSPEARSPTPIRMPGEEDIDPVRTDGDSEPDAKKPKRGRAEP